MTRDRESSKQAEKRAKKSRIATLAASMPQRSEGIRMSVEGSNSPTTSQSSILIAEKSKKKKRGPAKMTMVCTSTSGKDMRRKLHFNERGQVIGRYSSKFSSDTGYLARQHVPIIIDRWGAVDSQLKDLLWELVQQNYVIDESHRGLTLRRMGTQWRQYKCSITRKIFEAVENGEMPNRLSSIRPENLKSDEEWEVFVRERLSPEFKAKSEKFKELQKSQTIVHTMSRKGYARLEDEMRKEAPVPSAVSRVHVWTRGHMRKDGEPVNEAVGEVVARLQELTQLTQSTSTQQSKASIRDDAISRVLGPERRGRVRGLGLGVTPFRLDAQVLSIGRVKQLEQSLLNLQTRFNELEAMLLKQAQQGQSTNDGDTSWRVYQRRRTRV